MRQHLVNPGAGNNAAPAAGEEEQRAIHQTCLLFGINGNLDLQGTNQQRTLLLLSKIQRITRLCVLQKEAFLVVYQKGDKDKIRDCT